jgi:hypothetical protein
MTDGTKPDSEPGINPWDRQPWETTAMFAAFTCYLMQEPPRSVERAFRERYPEKAEARRVKDGGLLTANGTWREWCQGRGSHGKQVTDNPITWAQRARLFDDWVHQQRIEEYRKRHLSADEVLALLADQARASLGDFTEVRTPADLKDHPLAHVLRSMTVDAKRRGDTITTRTRVEPHNSQRALELYMRHLKLFENSIDLTSGGKPIDQSIMDAINAIYGGGDDDD